MCKRKKRQFYKIYILNIDRIICIVKIHIFISIIFYKRNKKNIQWLKTNIKITVNK